MYYMKRKRELMKRKTKSISRYKFNFHVVRTDDDLCYAPDVPNNQMDAKVMMARKVLAGKHQKPFAKRESSLMLSTILTGVK
jgi:hypothetical protein